MALLDGAEAKTVLLVAAAGYGKTTIARQWAKTLQKSLWLTLTPAHRDLAVLAVDFTRGIEALGGETQAAIGRYVLSRANPQRAAREIALLVAEQIDLLRVPWIVLDDYHELISSPEAELFVDVLRSSVASRLLIASRASPSWATDRLAVYGETHEVGREELAMDQDESSRLLGRRRGLGDLVAQAEGWPAVLGLAARTGSQPRPQEHRVPSSLYQFFADELYQATPSGLRDDLMRLALAADLSDSSLKAMFGGRAAEVVSDLRDRGFLSATGPDVELHPLVREFLLQKLAAEDRFDDVVRFAISACVERERWIRAFDLIQRFALVDLMEPTLEAAYLPLLRSGRLGTLSDFAEAARHSSRFPPAVVDLVEAEMALRDGKFKLAVQIAERVAVRLPPDHALQARTQSVIGQCSFVHGRLEDAQRAYRIAFKSSDADEEKAEALRGWALASIQCEAPDSSWALSQLEARKHGSPLDLLRYRVVDLNRRRFAEGFAEPLQIDQEMKALASIEDPRVRSGFTASAAYVTAVRADYRDAAELMAHTDELIAAYDLDFARPYAIWNNAFIALGLRQFGLADRLLQALEDLILAKPVGFHILNARLLRARLCLQTGQPSQALDVVASDPREPAIPSVRGEYLAIRAIAFAVVDENIRATQDAALAEGTTNAVEVRSLAQTARALIAAKSNDPLEVRKAWAIAERLGAWDALVTGLRSSVELGEAIAEDRELRAKLSTLYSRTSDLGLARKVGLRVRTTGRPDQLLSQREFEVLELLARGFRNRDIAEALVLSQSTVKVHIRHIMEKLGVRTRTEAVARLGSLNDLG